MKGVERWLERLLWNSRFVVVVAVVASVVSGYALFYLATVDVVYLVKTMLDLLYFSAAVALVGLALFLTHKSDA